MSAGAAASLPGSEAVKMLSPGATTVMLITKEVSKKGGAAARTQFPR